MVVFVHDALYAVIACSQFAVLYFLILVSLDYMDPFYNSSWAHYLNHINWSLLLS